MNFLFCISRFVFGIRGFARGPGGIVTKRCVRCQRSHAGRALVAARAPGSRVAGGGGGSLTGRCARCRPPRPPSCTPTFSLPETDFTTNLPLFNFSSRLHNVYLDKPCMRLAMPRCLAPSSQLLDPPCINIHINNTPGKNTMARTEATSDGTRHTRRALPRRPSPLASLRVESAMVALRGDFAGRGSHVTLRPVIASYPRDGLPW